MDLYMTILVGCFFKKVPTSLYDILPSVVTEKEIN